MRDLEGRGLLKKSSSFVVSPRSPTGWAEEFRYTLQGPFSKRAAAAAQEASRGAVRFSEAGEPHEVRVGGNPNTASPYGRPIPRYTHPAARHAAGSRQLRPSMMSRPAASILDRRSISHRHISAG